MSNSFLKNDLLQSLSESKHGLRKYLSERYTREIVLAEANLNEAGNEQHMRELELYMDNTNMIYQQKIKIEKYLYDKFSEDRYSHKEAMKLWLELVDMGAMSYQKEYGDKWTQIFTKDDRKDLAKQYADWFKKELETDSPDLVDYKKG